MDKRVERADLNDHRVQYELACRAAGIGVWELHVGEDRLEYSDIARQIFGFPLDGPVTREMVHAAIHPDDLEIVLTAARRALDPSVREDGHYVYRILRQDTRELRWLRGYGIARFADGAGECRPMLYAGSVEDITQRELTRRALASSEERLRIAMDAAEMAVWDLDLATGEVAHSPGLNLMLGFLEASRPTIEQLRSRYAPGERDRLEAEGAAARARGEKSLQTRVCFVVPGKGEVTYVLRAAMSETTQPSSNSNRVIGVLFDATDQARAEQRLVTLNHELRHRLKNMANLAGIFARQTWRGDPQLDTYLGRVRALAMSADLMFGSHGDNLQLRDLLDHSLAPFRNPLCDPFDLQGPEVGLTEQLFSGIALVLHELATNASKHGALSTPGGRVGVSWTLDHGRVEIDWREAGGPPVSPPARRGFGLNLLQRGALPPPHSVALEFESPGLHAKIVVQLIG